MVGFGSAVEPRQFLLQDIGYSSAVARKHEQLPELHLPQRNDQTA